MLRRYPKHEKAELAHLYCCLDAIQLKETALAEKISRSFYDRYPNSVYRSLLERQMGSLVKVAGNNDNTH
jgi:hypothetical protein